jgi:hypothetical protein
MVPEVTIDDTPTSTIDDAEASSTWITKNSSTKDSNKILNRACASEPEGATRTHTLEDHKSADPRVVNDLDVAYAEIPEAERDTWYERADRALAAAGMPDWMRIAPTVKAAAVRMWCGLEPVTMASG